MRNVSITDQNHGMKIKPLPVALQRLLVHSVEYPALRYSGGLIFFTLALGLRLFRFPVQAGMPFFTFYSAITLATLFRGSGSALVVIALSDLVCDYLFIPVMPEESAPISRRTSMELSLAVPDSIATRLTRAEFD